MLSGSSITLIVGGSIAAYKSAELVRELSKRGANVNVVMTAAACEFISPLTMQTLSGNPVTTELFNEHSESEIGHISLADKAHMVVCAPASADMLAKAANGICDDVATTVLLATTAPILFAPAMNVNMWMNKATQENVVRLRERGVLVVDPDEGDLACGWIGAGRLAELSTIVEEMEYLLSPKDLSGSHVVVTAGPTREAMDPIRFISNRSSGKMGYAIARVARFRGARVSLVSGPSSIEPPIGVDFYPVVTAQEMRDQVISLVEAEQPCDDESEICSTQFVFMAAAIADHRPTEVAELKLKKDKSKGYTISMEPTTDVLKELGELRAKVEKSSGRRLKLVGFAAETTQDEEELMDWAKQKLAKKDADLMVGNFADYMSKDTNRVWLIDRVGREEQVATADKQFIAGKIVRAALKA